MNRAATIDEVILTTRLAIAAGWRPPRVATTPRLAAVVADATRLVDSGRIAVDDLLRYVLSVLSDTRLKTMLRLARAAHRQRMSTIRSDYRRRQLARRRRNR